MAEDKELRDVIQALREGANPGGFSPNQRVDEALDVIFGEAEAADKRAAANALAVAEADAADAKARDADYAVSQRRKADLEKRNARAAKKVERQQAAEDAAREAGDE